MVLEDNVEDLKHLADLIDASKAENRILGDVCNGAFHLKMLMREDMTPVFDQARDFVMRVATGEEFRNRASEKNFETGLKFVNALTEAVYQWAKREQKKADSASE